MEASCQEFFHDLDPRVPLVVSLKLKLEEVLALSLIGTFLVLQEVINRVYMCLLESFPNDYKLF
jgi:hypothetical protein